MRDRDPGRAILRRRRRYVTAALAALAATATADFARGQEAGLDASSDARASGDAGDTEPEACLCACEAPGGASDPRDLVPMAAALAALALVRRSSRVGSADDQEATKRTEES